MADTLIAAGDSSGRHFIAKKFIEAIIVLPMTTTGIHSVRLRTISGLEYYAYFESAEQLNTFVMSWAGETQELDAEPYGPETEDADGIF